jgi:hypothetical protein
MDQPPSLVKPFHGIHQVAEKCISPQLSVAEHVQAATELELDRFVDGAILEAFELGIGQAGRFVILARLLQIGGAQQAADNVASIHAKLLSDSDAMHSDVGDVRKYSTKVGRASACLLLILFHSENRQAEARPTRPNRR